MKLKRMHGEFDFQVQKYHLNGVSLNSLELTQPLPESHVSRGLQESSVYYSNRLSEREAAELVARHCGRGLLSEPTNWQFVQQPALQASVGIESITRQQLASPASIEIAAEIDLYDGGRAQWFCSMMALGSKPTNRSASAPVPQKLASKRSQAPSG